MPKRKREPIHRVRTFDEWAKDFRITKSEREALIWHLAQYRMQRTLEAFGLK